MRKYGVKIVCEYGIGGFNVSRKTIEANTIEEAIEKEKDEVVVEYGDKGDFRIKVEGVVEIDKE